MIKYGSFFVTFMWIVVGFGQSTNSSPYSYFGIGEYNQQTTVTSSGMGGLGVTQNNYRELNFSNPAGNSRLQFTTFGIAGNTHFLKIDDGSEQQESWSTRLAYLALGIPIGKKAGMMFGLQSSSNVNYSITEELFDENNTINEKNTFEGEGGGNRFFGSFAYQITEDIGLGIEAEYIFGKIDHSIINQRLGVLFYSRYRQLSNVKGGSVKLGVQYRKKLKENLEVRTGLTTKLKNNLSAESEEYLYSFRYNTSGIEIPHDTLTNASGIKGKIVRPLSWAAGVGIGKSNNWYAGIEYASRQALRFDQSVFKKNNKMRYSKSSKLSVGGFWIPKENSIESYWNRVAYRAGIKFENSGLAINPNENSEEFTPIDDFGISFGLGFPIGSKLSGLSRLNFSVEIGSRGKASEGLIKENYYNFRLSLDIAEKWFHKRKIH